MKKLILLLTVIAMTFALVACGEKEEEPQTGIANPWVDCATLADAAELAGFDINVPDRIDGYPDILIQAVEKDMIQVIYSKGDKKSVTLRKGKDADDILGDYEEYAEESTKTMHGVEVSLKGKDGKIYDAVWSQGDYAYCIYADHGMKESKVDELVELME